MSFLSSWGLPSRKEDTVAQGTGQVKWQQTISVYQKELQKVERAGDKKTFKLKLERKGASHERSGEKGLPGRRREHPVQRPWGVKECGMCKRQSFLSPQPREYLKSINKKKEKPFVLSNVRSELCSLKQRVVPQQALCHCCLHPNAFLPADQVRIPGALSCPAGRLFRILPFF